MAHCSFFVYTFCFTFVFTIIVLFYIFFSYISIINQSVMQQWTDMVVFINNHAYKDSLQINVLSQTKLLKSLSPMNKWVSIPWVNLSFKYCAILMLSTRFSTQFWCFQYCVILMLSTWLINDYLHVNWYQEVSDSGSLVKTSKQIQLHNFFLLQLTRQYCIYHNNAQRWVMIITGSQLRSGTNIEDPQTSAYEK